MNKSGLILFLVIIISFCALAQKKSPDSTPKVGLVLSGGGAKGFAHIGALKVIDSLNIKIDYVAGTSMGAIIGSLYASGYSGKQLDSIFKSLDFDKIISDDLPRGAKTFYERDNSEKYAVTLPFNKFKLKLPSALSRGQNVFNLLSKLTLHVNEVERFKDLPIPFFCIATNVETGEAVMLDKGNLAQALLASGAFPSLFQPVVINNQVLIDGGVVNNYPVDELRAKGMDIIIGVDVQDDLKTKEELGSAPDVLLQINNFRTINDMKSKVGKTEVYIKPDITDFSVVSFSEGDRIIESGKEAALLKTDVLANLPKYSKKNPKKDVKIISTDSIKINRIGIFGSETYTRSYIQGKLKIKPDTKVSYEDFSRGINNLVATNNFETFQYELKKSPHRKGYDLKTELTENKITTFLKLGIHYDDLYKSAALANFTKKRVLFDNDIVTLDVILGDNVRYNFEYFIDKGFHWSIGLRSRYNQFHKNINADLFFDEDDQAFSGLNKVDVELKDQTNQFYLQTMIKKDFAFRIGAEHKRLNIKSETLVVDNQEDEFVFENTDYFSAFGSIKLDTYDDIYYPNKGVYFNGDFQMYLFASNFNKDFESFSIAQADMGYAFSVSDKLSFNLKTSGGFKIGENSTQALDFALGGYGNNFINNFIPFLGYDFISLTGNSFVKASALADYEIFKKHHITLEGNWANIEDNMFETGEWFTLPDYRGYALGYGIETFLGPVQAKFSYSPEQKTSTWFFNIGFWF
ncbi:patatin-like phospholipase family protein [Ichthyenterobacterium magnum]|uniref:NTE family protein n=1 Tax=Ichthyenterobacterium magnum TaxID=1230530 RepID=A0A420DWG2_9FLAO|nr:patatin-like phospholipase family protein [Ichthyenterobacterium magnum]RKE98576.1 NTE family protein [Ichthyenterobacterium magnum]